MQRGEERRGLHCQHAAVEDPTQTQLRVWRRRLTLTRLVTRQRHLWMRPEPPSGLGAAGLVRGTAEDQLRQSSYSVLLLKIFFFYELKER